MLQRQAGLDGLPAAALPLFMDEQYVVNLFNVSSDTSFDFKKLVF